MTRDQLTRRLCDLLASLTPICRTEPCAFPGSCHCRHDAFAMAVTLPFATLRGLVDPPTAIAPEMHPGQDWLPFDP